MLPTMSGSWECESCDTWELSDIVGSTCNTLGQRGPMLNGDTVPCPKEQSSIVWTDLSFLLRVSDEMSYPSDKVYARKLEMLNYTTLEKKFEKNL